VPDFFSSEWLDKYFLPVVRICGLVFLVLWLTQVGILIYKKASGFFVLHRSRSQSLASLELINPPEAKVLLTALDSGSDTFTYADWDEVGSLCYKGLLVRIGAPHIGFVSLHIPPFVWKEINKPEVKMKIIEKAKQTEPRPQPPDPFLT
jgi:hypothetical protein